MEPLLEGLLRSLGGSEANFLEVCFGRIPCGNFYTKATSKKSRPPSGRVVLKKVGSGGSSTGTRKGASFAEKTESKNSTREFGPKFGSPKFV